MTQKINKPSREDVRSKSFIGWILGLVFSRGAFTPNSSAQGPDQGPCFCYVVYIWSGLFCIHTANRVTDFIRRTCHLEGYAEFRAMFSKLSTALSTTPESVGYYYVTCLQKMNQASHLFPVMQGQSRFILNR